MIEKVNNIKLLSTIYDFDLIKYLNNTKEFSKLETFEVSSGRSYDAEELTEFSKLMKNHNSLKL